MDELYNTNLLLLYVFLFTLFESLMHYAYIYMEEQKIQQALLVVCINFLITLGLHASMQHILKSFRG